MYIRNRATKKGEVISTKSDKDRLLQIVEDRRKNNQPFTNREMSDFMNVIAEVEFIRYADEYMTVINQLELTLSGNDKLINSDYGEIDPTGTPFEN